jgi:hypothetical protein
VKYGRQIEANMIQIRRYCRRLKVEIVHAGKRLAGEAEYKATMILVSQIQLISGLPDRLFRRRYQQVES